MCPPNRGRANAKIRQGITEQAGKYSPIQTQARMTMMPVRDHKEPGKNAHRKAEVARATPKGRGRSNSDPHARATHRKPLRPAAARTEAHLTMMPVRDHKESGRPVHAKAKPKARRPLNRKENKKPGFWRSVFGLAPKSPDRATRLDRAATVGKDSRVKFDNHTPKDPFYTRGDFGGRRLQRPTTSYGEGTFCGELIAQRIFMDM